MNEYELLLSEMESIPTYDTESKMQNKLHSLNFQDKKNKLDVAKANKEVSLRKDVIDYGNDNWLVESAKSFANEFLPHEYQLAVNKDGKRYNSANKDFNDNDLSNIWNKYQDDPGGDKVLYYLRKEDPYTGQYVYKPGIAHISAADRYITQTKADGWELLGEKRFNEASAVEKQIHGNKAFLQDRTFDYGTTGQGGADNFFGSGKSELYNRDILGLDTGTSEQYEDNMDASVSKMLGLIPNHRQREDTFEFIDALEAGGIKVGGDIVKAIGEAVSSSEGDGALEALGKKWSNDANRMAGYNPKGAAEGMKGFEDTWNDGDVVGFIGHMLKSGPQILAQSIPQMIAVGGTAAIGTYVTKNPLTGLATASSIFGGVRANDILDTREELTGNKASDETIRNVYAGSTLLTALEYGALKYAFTGKGLIAKDAAGKTVDVSKKMLNTPRKRMDMATMLGERLGKGMFVEGGEEVISGLAEFIMTKYGTDKYKGITIADMLTSEEARTTAIQSFGAGAGAGGLAGTIGAAGSTIKDKAVDIKKEEMAAKVKAEAEKGLGAVDTLLKAGYSQEDIDTMDAQSISKAAKEVSSKKSREMTQEKYDLFKEELTTTLKNKGTSEEQIQSTINKISEGIKIVEDIVPDIGQEPEQAPVNPKVALLEKKIKELDRQIVDDPSMEKTNRAKINELHNKISEIEGTSPTVTNSELDAPKMSSTITKSMKEKNLGLEVDNDLGRLNESGGHKPKSFNIAEVTDTNLVDVAEGRMEPADVAAIPGATDSTKMTQSLPKKLSVNSEIQKLIAKVYSNIKDKMNKGLGKKELAELSTDTSEGKGLRVAAIVGDVVRDQISSEIDVTDNLGKDNKDVDYARSSSVELELGKRYVNSYGMKISGRSKDINKLYTELGRSMLKYAEAVGLITTEAKNIPALKLTDSSGKPIIQPRDKRAAGFTPVESDTVQETVIKLSDSIGTGKSYESDFGVAMNSLSGLLRTFNEKLPDTEASKEVYADPESKPTPTQTATIKKLQGLKFQVKANGLAMLKALHAEAKTYPDYDHFFKSATAKKLLRTNSSKSWLTKSRDRGRAINRQRNLRSVFEALDQENSVINDTFHYSYQAAVNNRIHVLETILEFQGDKFMSRNLITGGEYTTNTAKSAQILMEQVAEEVLGAKTKQELLTGIAELKEPTKDTPIAKVVEYMSKYAKDGKKPKDIPLEEYVTYANILGIGNVFEAMSISHAVYDIATAKDKTRITTEYMPESDMTASGVINTLMNLAGIPSIAKTLKEIIDTGIDPYAYVSNHLKDVIPNAAYNEYVGPTLAKLEGMNISMRDSIKYAIMPWFYGSDKVTSNMANDLAVDIVNKGNTQSIEFINEVLGTNFTKDINKSITKDQFAAITEHLESNLSSYYEKAIVDLFPGVIEYRKQMGELFDILNTSTNWDGKIGTAMMALGGKSDRKYRMSVKKDKQTPLKVGETPVIMNEKFNNRKSFFVNLQHGTDSAELIFSLGRTLAKSKYKNWTQGIATVHDAEMASSNILEDLQPEYEGTLKEVALKYDMLQTAIEETLYNLKQMEQTKSIKEKVARVEAMSEANKIVMSKKKEFLSRVTTNFFGSKTLDNTTNTPVKEEEVKPKPKPKPKPKNESYSKVINLVNSFNSKNMNKVLKALKDLSITSPTHKELLAKVIKGFEDGVALELGEEYRGGYNKIKVIGSGKNKYKSPTTNKPMVAEEIVEILAHEMDHAINFEYISNNMNSPELKYMKRAVEDLKKVANYSKETTDRIKYILDPVNDEVIQSAMKKKGITEEEARAIYQVSEMISVMRNEPKVYEEIISKEVAGSNLSSKLIRLVKKMTKWVAGLTPEKIKEIFRDDLEVTYRHTIAAMEIVDMNAKLAKDAPTKVSDQLGSAGMTQSDVYKDAANDPMKYVDGMIARQNAYVSALSDSVIGSAITVASPLILQGHKNLVKHSDLYASTVNKIRTGFVSSEFAQKLRAFIGSEKDVDDKVLNKLLQESDDIAQEMNQIATTLLPDLDRQINNMYKNESDRIKVYELFSKTGIAGIQHDRNIVAKFLTGKLDVNNAIKELEAKLDTVDVQSIDKVAEYYATGVIQDGMTNLKVAGVGTKTAEVLVALKVMKKLKLQDISNTMNRKLKNELYRIAISNRALSHEINTNSLDYDGTYNMDVYDSMYEYRLITKTDMRRDKYSEESDWKVIQSPESNEIGIVARSTQRTSVDGVGLNKNKFENGVYVESSDADILKSKLNSIRNEEDRKMYLQNNSIVETENGGFKIVLSEKVKRDKLNMKQSAAHSLYRTYIHNTELLAMQTVRDIALNEATDTISTELDMDKFNDRIATNKSKIKDKDNPHILPMFINVEYDYKAYSKLPIWVRRYYKVASRVSTYKGLSDKITLVKKGESDILMGHPNFSPFSGDTKASRNLAKSLEAWKKVVVMAKQHMAVANAGKLAVDITSNVGILMTKDVGPIEAYKGINKGWKEFNSFNKLRSELVLAKVKAGMGSKTGMARVKRLEKEISNHAFYPAFKAGFVQSYSTQLAVKEFDTISGLQKDIDDIVNGITKDKKGNPNEVFKAIKWWQHFGANNGVTVDAVIKAATKLSRTENTSVGEELVAMTNRLKKIREDENSVAGYISNIIGSPMSEAVIIGGAVMVTADVLSKYTLAESLKNRLNKDTGKLYTTEEAYVEANETFIDYRKNMPSEMKALSDLGILMFPGFWVKAQKVIINLVHYHPTTAISGYVIADMLDISNSSFLDVNIVNKLMEGTVVNSPDNLVDWNLVSNWL